MTYIREVDYKGLNGSVTPAIDHMTRNIECIHRKITSKHHAYMISTTYPVIIGVSAI
jgi:hypothetical protein